MAPDRVDLAHARLLRDHSLQFHFAPYASPPTPSWLSHLFKLIGAALPDLATVFWIVFIAGALAAVVYIAVDRAAKPRRAALSTLRLGEESWTPSAPAARALLAEADRLAAEGSFAEAAHILLIRSVEDIRERRPHLVAPSFTSRDIAGSNGLPEAARAAFRPIVAQVERSLFGGRPLDAEAFAACRRSYENFALPTSWTAGSPA